MNERYLFINIEKDLKEKMVFIGGPRQVGKTTLALGFLNPPTVENPAYLNWDNLEDQPRIMRGELPPHLRRCPMVGAGVHPIRQPRGDGRQPLGEPPRP